MNRPEQEMAEFLAALMAQDDTPERLKADYAEGRIDLEQFERRLKRHLEVADGA